VTVKRTLGRIGVATVWLVVAILVALGGAGVATAMNRIPGTAGRPELTYAGDRVAGPALDDATARLQALSDAVDGLGTSARSALTDLVGADAAALSTTIDAGTAQLAQVQAARDALAASLAQVPYASEGGSTADLHLSAATKDRYAALLKTPALTTRLEGDWALLSARALAASSIPTLLAKHDAETAAAAAQGSAAHYRQAIALLDAPTATLAKVGLARDGLAKSADVSTLTSWIDRNAAYDAALRNLYSSLLDAKGRVTDAVRAAFAGEQAARAQLPKDTRAIVVIMSDIAQGGLNQAVIDIEVARGALGAALDAQQQHVTPGASPAP
jgi:hypothetical protein